MIPEKDFIEEKAYLDFINSLIDEKISESEIDIEEYRKDIITKNKDMYDEYGHSIEIGNIDSDLINVASEIQLKNNALDDEFNEFEKLSKLKRSPYFARIDFSEDGEIEKTYIGPSSLMDNDYNIYVSDWRSDIASLYYEFGVGKASFYANNYKNDVDIKLKRQFKIENGKFVHIFDNEYNINDDVLSKVLTSNCTGEMKNIVSTIGKEQNVAIRNDDYKFTLILGCAGSGKTSVLLHKIAYILFKKRNQLNHHNILIFSPNDIFSNYIKDVLPSLFEKNPRTVNFNRFFGRFFKDTAFLAQEEYEFYKEKNSKEFTEKLETKVNELRPTFEDIYFLNEKIFDKSDLEKRFFDLDDKYNIRINKIFRFIMSKIKENKKGYIQKAQQKLVDDYKPFVHEDLNELRLKSRLTYMIEVLKIKHLYDDKIVDPRKLYCEACFEIFNNDFSIENLKECDIAGCVYLGVLLGDFWNLDNFKYIFIDEAQDYSYIQYKVLKEIFKNAKFTVTGDLMQDIYKNNYSSESFISMFEKNKTCVFELNKSYRSSSEITEFSKSIIKNNKIENAVKRLGGEVELYITKRKLEVLKELILADYGLNTIAIITNNKYDAEQLYKELKSFGFDIIVSENEYNQVLENKVIIPYKLAKGLEFDRVIIYDTKEFKKDEDERSLYVCATRALHKLQFIFEELPSILEDVDKNLYRRIDI